MARRGDEACTERRTVSRSMAGSINPITRKAYLDDSHRPRTVRHAMAVLRGFYEYWADIGEGPVANPVQRGVRARLNAHHNPMDPFRPEGRMRCNPASAEAATAHAVGRPVARRVHDAALASGSSAARSGAQQRSASRRVAQPAWRRHRLGRSTRARPPQGALYRAVAAASAEAFVWLRLYLADAETVGPNEPIWRTIRRRDRVAGLEQTQLVLVRDRLPDTGEVIPLLQVVPSKTNQEWLLVVTPELASVLATVVSRLRTTGGNAIPLVARYRIHEPRAHRRRVGRVPAALPDPQARTSRLRSSTYPRTPGSVSPVAGCRPYDDSPPRTSPVIASTATHILELPCSDGISSLAPK